MPTPGPPPRRTILASIARLPRERGKNAEEKKDDRIEGRCNFGYTCCSLIYINRERERGLESCKDLNVKGIEINVTF